jgi:excisionase family DNA binding protein
MTETPEMDLETNGQDQAQSHDPDDRLLSPRAAAKILDCKLGALRQRIQRKQLPVVKVGRCNYIRYTDLMRYIKTRPDRHKSPMDVEEEQTR